MSDLQWMSLTLCLVGVIPVGNFSINDTFFSLICPYSETPASLKTPSPSQGFQILRQQTTSIHNWYFYNAHSGHFKCLHSWFPTANKTKTCKQTKSHRSTWAKTTCHFPRITEFQSSTNPSFDKIRGKGTYMHFPISCLLKLLNSIQNLPRPNLFLPSASECSLKSWKRHFMKVNWGQPLLKRSHKYC